MAYNPDFTVWQSRDYPTERKFSLRAISLMTNSLNLNSAYYYIFWEPSMIGVQK